MLFPQQDCELVTRAVSNKPVTFKRLASFLRRMGKTLRGGYSESSGFPEYSKMRNGIVVIEAEKTPPEGRRVRALQWFRVQLVEERIKHLFTSMIIKMSSPWDLSVSQSLCLNHAGENK